jgi:Holliday junction resolvasome RuvABC endonuclease subunit
MMILGVDPGLAHLGLALYLPDTTSVWAMTTIRTKPAKDRKHHYKADDNVRRARDLAQGMSGWLSTQMCYRGVPRIKAICAEAQSWPRNAAASAKVGMAWGVIVAWGYYDIPIYQLSPQKIKKHLCGKNSASKQAVRDALMARYDIADDMWPSTKKGREDAGDALAAAVACWETHPVLVAARCVTKNKEG